VIEEEYTSPSSRYRRPGFLDNDDRYGREIQPYRNQRDYEDYDTPRRPARPKPARRQSSLDTYDRKPMSRYSERDRDYQERDVNVSINVQAPPPPPAAGAPRYREYEYKARSPSPEVVIRREREIIRQSGRQEIEDDYVEIEVPEEPKRKKGKTRMPKRLVHKNALNRMQFPYEEEVCPVLCMVLANILTSIQENFYVVLYALQKEEIDEVIKISEGYFDDSTSSPIQLECNSTDSIPDKTVYKFQETQETRLLESGYPMPDMEAEVHETITRKIIENPTPSDFGTNIRSISESDSSSGSSTKRGGRSVKSARTSKTAKTSKTSRTSKSKARTAKSSARSRSRHGGKSRYESEEEEEIVITQGALIIPERSRKHSSVNDVDAQIHALEQEKKALKLEREAREKLERAERLRDSEYEIVEDRKREVVRVEKDKRGRLALVKSAR
jgi:hypothetical protein